MDIITAIKSGKPFKREKDQFFCMPYTRTYSLYAEDILATDWEIEEPKVEITKAEFSKAADRVMSRFVGYQYGTEELTCHRFFLLLTSELFDKEK